MMLRPFLHRLHIVVLRVLVEVHVLLLIHREVSVANLHIACKMHVLVPLHLNIRPSARLWLYVHHLSLFHVNVHCVLARIKRSCLLLLRLRLVISNELSILVLLVLLIHFHVFVWVYHLMVHDGFHLRMHLLWLHHHLLLDHIWWEWHLYLTFMELSRVIVELLLWILLVWKPLSHIRLLVILIHWNHRSHVIHCHRAFHLMLLCHVFKSLGRWRHLRNLLLGRWRHLGNLLLEHSMHLARFWHHILVKLLVHLIHLIYILLRHLGNAMRRSWFLLNLVLMVEEVLIEDNLAYVREERLQLVLIVCHEVFEASEVEIGELIVGLLLEVLQNVRWRR